MLKLRRIELLGFKSFYDRSEIAITDSGITAVVGPNGCGKSNISDAVAWVLGEQRARSLRGDRMEDVIFSGTRNRSPLGMAEVTITLIDDAPLHSNGGPPPGPVEVTVQRRLFRSGESQYLLNGRPCRLRDIQDIFLGTGLGPHSYAIIEQGRIGQLLSARPSDRRTLIEEAAGVTKFRAKRKLAESRLEAARQNLSRVNDILTEVERQRNSLKRQASKARRYREVRKRLRGILSAVFSTRAELLIDQKERVEAALAGMASEGQRLESGIAELDELVHQCRIDVETQERQLEESRERRSATELEHEKAVQRLARLQDQVGAFDQRSGELAAEKARVTRELETHSQELGQCESRMLESERTISDVRSQLEQTRDGLETTSGRRSEEEAAIEDLRNQRFSVVGQEAQIRNELSSRAEMIQRIEAQSDRVEAEERKSRSAAESCRSRLRTVELDQSSRQSQIRELGDERQSAEREYDSLKLQLAEAQHAASEARSREEGIRHRLEAIRELSLDRAYGSESVQQFFKHARQESSSGGSWTICRAPLGILADFVEVEPDYETVVEDLLHAELQYVVVRDLPHAEEALEIVRNTTRGRLNFLVLDPDRELPSAREVVPGANRVAEVIRLDDQIRHFSHHISNAYIVDDLQRAWDLSESHPGKTFVARSGEVVRDRVISWGERSGHGPLSLKREMRDLDRRIEVARTQTESTAALLRELESRIEVSDQRKADLSNRLQDAEKEALGHAHGLRALRSELERAEQQARIAGAEIERFRDERRELEEAVTVARSSLAEVSARMKAIDEELETRTRSSEELWERSSRLEAEVADLRSSLAVLEERGETLGRERRNLKTQVTELADRGARADRQSESNRAQKEETLRSISAGATARQDLLGRREELEQLISSASARLDGLRQELHEAESGWDEARGGLDSWKDRHNEREIEKTRVDADIEHLVSLCFSELGETIESVCLDSFETLSPEALEEYEGGYQELRQKLDSMGSVNMMAVEEYDEAQQRFEFLTTQRQDLLDSIRDTAQAIDEIDTVCRKQFKDAFERINVRFQKAFVELFGGGQGELRLIDQGEAADAGIEIVAQPPGKKLQNVLLLSGGEKALAALSLLIALFQFKPSPFCLLDEVDAPLDDANIDRFAHLIREMSEKTQFIVITHSKRTMETANQLYGVTMEEPGISKVVSVRLN